MFFRRKSVGRSSYGERLAKWAETGAKCALLLFYPAGLAAVISSLWYFLCFRDGFHFGENLERIALAWISMFSVLYSLLAAIALNTVWSEYKAMRTAIKRYDLDTFMDLRDEDLSPLLHTTVLALSLSVLFGFAALHYPSAMSGIVVIFGISFLTLLIYFVTIQIDDPTSGLWFIRNIPDEWLLLDPKDYRQKRWDRIRSDLGRKEIEEED